MCARFSLTSPIEALRQLFHFPQRPNLRPAYNIAPTNNVAAIRLVRSGGSSENELFFAQWGLVPAWVKDPSIASKLINARSETVQEKPSFKKAFSHHRCLIPANGFFEWQRQQDGSKQPFYFHPVEGDIVAFAGLWEAWQDPENQTLQSCTILTMPASPEVLPIHGRMPVTVPLDCFEDWLTGTDTQSLPGKDQQTRFKVHPVHKKVGNVKNDSADLIEEISIPPAPMQGNLFS